MCVSTRCKRHQTYVHKTIIGKSIKVRYMCTECVLNGGGSFEFTCTEKYGTHIILYETKKLKRMYFHTKKLAFCWQRGTVSIRSNSCDSSDTKFNSGEIINFRFFYYVQRTRKAAGNVNTSLGLQYQQLILYCMVEI